MSETAARNQPEVWLRGPIAGITPSLQPVAHALLQAREEVGTLMHGFPAERLWERPAGVASAGFHLRHMAGVLDRLTTYATGDALTDAQLSALRAEPQPDPDATPGDLADAFALRVDQTLGLLRGFRERDLAEPRAVGRAALPSTALGLLVHAAEHTMRHLGQLLVTVRVVSDEVRSRQAS